MDDAARRWRLLARGLGLALLLSVGVFSFIRAVRLDFDFHHFYPDARYVWEHGALNPHMAADPDVTPRRLPFYLPTVATILAPLTAGGVWPAALAWSLMQVASLAVAGVLLARWGLSREPDASARLLVVGLLAAPALYEAARFNQLSFPILALVLAGFAALERGRAWRGGALLGVAAVLKLLPGILLVYLVLKRQWRAATGFVAAALLLTLLPPLLVYGPERTVAYHREWWQHNMRGAAARGMTDPELREHFIDHRNQALPAVAARWLWRDHPYAMPWQPVRTDASTPRLLAAYVATLLLVGLFVTTRGAWPALAEPARRAEFAVFVLAMVAFSPLLRQYYLVWALPALVVLAVAAQSGQRPASRLGWAGLLVWLGGMLAWAVPLLRLGGIHLFMLIALGVLTLAAGRRMGGAGPAAEPAGQSG